MDTAKRDKWWDACLGSAWPVWQMGCSLFPSQTWRAGESSRERTRGRRLCSETFICLDSRQTPFRWPSQPEDRPFPLGLDPFTVPTHRTSSGSSQPSQSHSFSNFFAILASAGLRFLPGECNKSGLSAHRGTPGAQDLTSLVIGLLTDTLPITKFKVGVDPTWFEISLSSLSVVGVGKG